MEKLPVHITLTLWGQAYIDTYLTYTIYNHFAPNNIPALLDDFAVHYTIYTFSPDIALRLGQSEVYSAFSGRVNFQVLVLNEIQSSNFYRVSAIHNFAVARAAQEKAIVCFVHTDQIWSDGSFRRAFEKIKEGYRSVETVLLRCSKEGFLSEFHSERASPSVAENTMAIMPRRLVEMAIKKRHPAAIPIAGGYIPFLDEPSIICRYVMDEGVVMRAAHFFPFVVYPQVYPSSIRSAEEDFAISMVPDKSKRYIVQDSDEVFGCDLSPDKVDLELADAVSPYISCTVGRYLARTYPWWISNFRQYSVSYHCKRKTLAAWLWARYAFLPLVWAVLAVSYSCRALEWMKKHPMRLKASDVLARFKRFVCR